MRRLGIALLLLAALPILAQDREPLKKAIPQHPADAPSRYHLGQLFATQGYRVPAVLELLRFLALDPNGPQSKKAAALVVDLLNAGVSKKGKSINVQVDPNASTDEGDFHTVDLGWTLAAGARYADEGKKSEFELLQQQVGASMAMLLEMKGETSDDYTSTNNVPFFAELDEKKLMDPFVAVAFQSLRLPGSKEWEGKNAEAVAGVKSWLEGRRSK